MMEKDNYYVPNGQYICIIIMFITEVKFYSLLCHVPCTSEEINYYPHHEAQVEVCGNYIVFLCMCGLCVSIRKNLEHWQLERTTGRLQIKNNKRHLLKPFGYKLSYDNLYHSHPLTPPQTLSHTPLTPPQTHLNITATVSWLSLTHN